MPFAVWTPAGPRCSGTGATPGARALMSWALDTYPEAHNGGIYVCRNVRGGDELSLHAVGRAGDAMFPLVDGKPNPAGLRLVQRLRPHARDLGIQALIFNRRIWSAKSPGPDGRPYNGVNPHRDHVHFELTVAGGAKLTKATIRHVLGAGVTPAGRPTLSIGDEGAAVAALQRKLHVTADGVFGPKTRAAVNAFKRRHGLPEDGIAGHKTWGLLDG